MAPWEEHTVDRNNVVVYCSCDLNAPLAWCEWMRETIGGTKCWTGSGCGDRWIWTLGWLNLTPLCSLYKVTATARRLLNTTNQRDVLINTASCSHSQTVVALEWSSSYLFRHCFMSPLSCVGVWVMFVFSVAVLKQRDISPVGFKVGSRDTPKGP